MAETRKQAVVRKIWIGTSGWSYDDWRGPFYPRDVAKRRWLGWYADQFMTTEINGSFYRTPSLETVRRWRDETPDGFLFAWKASKFITHWKRLGDDSPKSLKLMNTRLRALGIRRRFWRCCTSTTSPCACRITIRPPRPGRPPRATSMCAATDPGGRYKNQYPDTELKSWADSIRRWRRGGREVFVYFDNDQKSAAPKDAQRLRSLLDDE